ncbi:MAG TPA: RsmE family RNA methyltransferase [Acidimicrobiia bacterium]
MGHVPHVLVPQPWDGDHLSLADGAVHHLERVMRLRAGDGLSYTDGAGRAGYGTYSAASMRRGAERVVARAEPLLTLAVAAPRAAERARYLVEKAAEVGTDRLVWLETLRGGARPPAASKVAAWARAALEQSRAAWLMETGATVSLGDLAAEGPFLAANPGGLTWSRAREAVAGGAGLTVAIGPEGGFDDDELPAAAVAVALGERILRVETAVVVVAALVRSA